MLESAFEGCTGIFGGCRIDSNAPNGGFLAIFRLDTREVSNIIHSMMLINILVIVGWPLERQRENRM